MFILAIGLVDTGDSDAVMQSHSQSVIDAASVPFKGNHWHTVYIVLFAVKSTNTVSLSVSLSKLLRKRL